MHSRTVQEYDAMLVPNWGEGDALNDLAEWITGRGRFHFDPYGQCVGLTLYTSVGPVRLKPGDYVVSSCGNLFETFDAISFEHFFSPIKDCQPPQPAEPQQQQRRQKGQRPQRRIDNTHTTNAPNHYAIPTRQSTGLCSAQAEAE